MNITPIKTIKARFIELAKTRCEFEAVELVAREFHLNPESVVRIVCGSNAA